LRLESSTEGVVVLDVANGSTAQSLGFQRGDLVVSVNNEKIADTRDLDRITKQPSRLWRVTILRGGQQISVVFGG
jgi:S1-C subfamily serine protease